MTPRNTELLERLSALEAEVADLRRGREERKTEAVLPHAGDGPDRRTVMRAGVAAAATIVGAGAANVVTASPAAATDPSLLIDQVNQGHDATTLVSNGLEPRTPPAVPIRTGLLTVSDHVSDGADGFPAAVAGVVAKVNATGVYGGSKGPSGGVGVAAIGHTPYTYGLYAAGQRAAIFIAGRESTPPAYTDQHGPGELQADFDGRIWVCQSPGSPGQ